MTQDSLDRYLIAMETTFFNWVKHKTLCPIYKIVYKHFFKCYNRVEI